MNQSLGMIEIQLDSETILGGDGVQRDTVDVDVQADAAGLPYFSGRTLKGVLRREAAWYVAHLPSSKQAKFEHALTTLFGEGDTGTEHRSNYEALRFGTAKFSDDIYKAIAEENLSNRDVFNAITSTRSMTSIDRETGTAQEGTLRQVRIIRKGYALFAPIFVNRTLDKVEKQLLETAIQLLRHLGMMRSRGKGEVTCQLHWNESFNQPSTFNEQVKNYEADASYISLNIHAQEPLKINDVLRTSDSTQALHYIPGHVLRGALVHAYISDHKLKQADVQTETIFNEAHVQFWNGYLKMNNKRSLPFPVHLFETKQQSRSELAEDEVRNIYNDLTDHIEEIRKEAPVRVNEQMMAVDRGRFIGGKVKQTSALHLALNGPHLRDGESKLYRYEGIAPQQTFQAVIKVTQQNDFIDWLLKQEEMLLWLGGARNSGYGRSHVQISTIEENPEHIAPIDTTTDELYIIATSHWILRNEHGQLVHTLDESWLSEQLGAKVTLQKHIVNPALTGGYVSTWRAYHPIIQAVRAGSVFHYKVEGAIDEDSLHTLVNNGVGQRRNEGFGRLTILTSWPYETLEKPVEQTDNRETIARKYSDKNKAQQSLRQFMTGIINHDVTNQINKKVNEWYASILANLCKQQSLGASKNHLTTTQIGNLLDVTAKIEQKIKTADNPVEVYNRDWARFWKSYVSRQTNKTNLNYEVILITDQTFGIVRLQDFIQDELPKVEWRSNYFSNNSIEISDIEWSIKALHLLLRQMIRDQKTINQTDKE